MNILDKITELREERHWTEYQLAEKSGLTQSTISSWYRKNMLPTIPTLTKICEAFGITLSQFFLDENERTVLLNDRQLQLLTSAAKLAPEQYDALIHFLEQL
jgi:transcriptional regulator with XRE-family HTH domain